MICLASEYIVLKGWQEYVFKAEPSAINDIRGAIWKSKDESAQYHARQLTKGLQVAYGKLASEIRRNINRKKTYKKSSRKVTKSDEKDFYNAVDFDLSKWTKEILAAAKIPLTAASEAAMASALKEIRWDGNLARESEIVDEVINDMIDKIASMPLATLKEQLKQIVEQEFAANKTVDEVADAISTKLDGVTAWKAKQIAQTTMTPAYNQAQLKAWQETGVEGEKEWLSMRDDRVRDAHQDLDMQRRPLNEPFEWEGSKAQHPGGFGVADLDIGCRCYQRIVPLAGGNFSFN